MKFNIEGVETAPEEIRDSINSILSNIDNSLSGYNKNSLLSRFNEGTSVAPDRLFMDMYAKAYDIFLETDGVVDAASAPLFDIWGFGFANESLPSDEELLEATDFLPFIEVAFGDSEVPYIRVSESKTNTGRLKNNKRILVNSRAMQFDMLRTNSLAYMWTSPIPAEILKANDLVQRRCAATGQFKDILISRAGYRFSKLDRTFIDKLYLHRNDVAYG